MSQGSNAALKAQLKTLIAAKQYEAAILLLKASDLPDKITFINRIRQRMKEERAAENVKVAAKPELVVPEKLPAPVRAKRDRGMTFWYGVIFAACLAAVIVLVGIPMLNTYINRYVDRMATVCEDVYRDAWLDETYTFNQWWQGCKGAAAHAMDLYGEEIRYCFDSQGQTDKLFKECLVDQEVYLNSQYLADAPKG